GCLSVRRQRLEVLEPWRVDAAARRGARDRTRQGLVVEGLVFPEGLRQQLIAHAHEGGANEVCGILAGNTNVVERVFPIRNVADGIHADDGVFRDRDTALPADGQRDKDYYM